MKFGLEPVTDDNVGMISPRAMRIPDPSNTNPRINDFLITFCEVAPILEKRMVPVNPNLDPISRDIYDLNDWPKVDFLS